MQLNLQKKKRYLKLQEALKKNIQKRKRFIKKNIKEKRI